MRTEFDKIWTRSRLKHWLTQPVRGDVINIAWPVLVELLLSSLFGMVDMIMLGRISDPSIAAASISAVGITNQPLFIGISLVQAINVGATAIIARYLGSKKTDKIEDILKHVMILSMFILAIPITIFGLVFTDSIMEFIGAHQDAIDVGRTYFKVVMIGFLFQSFNLSISAALRGIGETKVPMSINLKVNFLNVFGNAVLIYGLLGFPELGVTGAGLSTTIANIIASILLFRYIRKGKSLVTFDIRKRFKFNKDIIYNLVKIGVPASIEQLVLRTTILVFAKIVAGLGTVVYAAHQIALSILNLSLQPGQAFGIAAASLIGKSLGTGELELAEDYAKETSKIGSMVSTFMALIFFFFGPQLVGLYSSDPEIIRSTSIALKIIAVVQPFQSSQLILAGGLRGAGDTVWTLVSTIIGVLVVRISLAYILVNKLGYGLVGAWVAVFVDQFVRWLVIYIRFRTGKWKYTQLR